MLIKYGPTIQAYYLHPFAEEFSGFLYFNDRWPQILELDG